MSEPLQWVSLTLPTMRPAAARDAVLALAGLSGQPRVVLEAHGRGGRVGWPLGADQRHLARIVAALQPHLPGLQAAADPDSRASAFSPTLATRLVLPGHRRTPLNVDQLEPATRGVLAALSSARATEGVTLQVILGHRRAPRRITDVRPRGSRIRDAPSAVDRRGLATKLAEFRFGCTVRLSARAATPERSRRLVSGVLSALRGLQAPGIHMVLRNTSLSAVHQARSPLIWPLELGVGELVGPLGWPLSSDVEAHLPGVASPHPRRLPLPAGVPRLGRPLGRSLLDPQRAVAQHPQDGLRHLHVLGPNGVGKSTLLARLALHDIQAGHGVVVIDPKGDLVDDLLARIPDARADDVVVLDPRSDTPVGIDCFAGEPELVADVLLNVFHSLYANAWGPRTNDLLHACLLSLSRRAAADPETGVSLLMVPLLLTQPGFRRSVTGCVSKADPLGLGSFWAQFEAWSDAERAQAIAPLMNKLRQVLLRPGLRAIFGQRHPRFALTDVFRPTPTGRGRILLVSLAEGSLGPEAAQLLGSLVVGLLWQAALGRISVPEAQRHPALMHIDEVQRYLRLPGDLGDALARARGLGVGFTLAHQHLGQLPSSLREAIMANARSKVAFQLSPADARVYAGMSGGQLDARDFETLPAFHAYTSLLTQNTPTPWASLVTEPLEPITNRAGRIRAARTRSAGHYGQPLDQLERELLELIQAGVPTSSTGNASGDALGRQRPSGASGADS